MFIIIIFFATQMVMFHTTNEITIASNTTLNSTHEVSVSGHMIRLADIFQIIMVLFVIGFGAAFLLSAGIDIKEYIGGGDFYER